MSAAPEPRGSMSAAPEPRGSMSAAPEPRGSMSAAQKPSGGMSAQKPGGGMSRAAGGLGGRAAAWSRVLGWDLASRLRLASGLTLFTFVTTHLLNHSLGLISLDAMLAGQRVFMAVWHSIPGTAVLLLAVATHLTLVLYKQVMRTTWRMPAVELLRIVLGVVTLLGLSLHAVRFVVYRLVYGTPVLYPDFLLGILPDFPTPLVILTLITAAWIHGCIGVHMWLRLRALYRIYQPGIAAAAALLPVLALLGVLAAAREADLRGNDSSWLTSLHQKTTPPPAANLDWLPGRTLLWVLALVAVLWGVRLAVQSWERRKGRVTVRYPAGRQVTATKGATLLEISRIGRVPHAAVCGGRGRCSTCRVHVDAGWDQLPPARDEEARVLARIKAPAHVRLACQVRPTADLSVTPLVPANARPRDALPYDSLKFGAEQEIVILFSDLRGFTKMSESKLPYDVVHILNQYFAEMGEAIETAGGYVDKFIGDGIMALFGLRGGVQAGAREALAAARAMSGRLEELNRRLAQDLAQPLKLGICIHVGHVIVGEMGYKRATSLTAIGDSVNVASRLESATKIAECQLLVSADVAARGSIDLSAFPLRSLKVRGREEALRVYVIDSAAALPLSPEPGAVPGGGASGGAARRPG